MTALEKIKSLDPHTEIEYEIFDRWKSIIGGERYIDLDYLYIDGIAVLSFNSFNLKWRFKK